MIVDAAALGRDGLQIRNSFLVPAPIEQARAVLNDIKRVAACVPGARSSPRSSATISTKAGSRCVSARCVQFAGTVAFRERDASRHHAVISATGNELKGRGNAHARMVCDLRADGK